MDNPGTHTSWSNKYRMKTYKTTQKTKKMSNKDHTHFSMLSI